MGDTDNQSVEKVIAASLNAYESFKSANVKTRAALMQSIADYIENLGDDLIEVTHKETNLPKARLINEKGRTINQWRSYAAAIESGVVLDLRIDSPSFPGATSKADIRKMMVGMGPVVIFGSSNFPYAFSTAGGDAASAIAAGNSVIIKTHPAHPETSAIMTKTIRAAIEANGFLADLFTEVKGGIEEGKYLVEHPAVKAVGFTGSFQGGKALFDLANNRKVPIPVFAEMGSINPVFLLPGKLNDNLTELAVQYVGSLTLGTGQFCTNPGVLISVKGEKLDKFMEEAKKEIEKKPAEKMLHTGIASSYLRNSISMIDHPAITVMAKGEEGDEHSGQAILATTSGKQFLNDEHLCGEVFGPFGLIVACDNEEEMERIAAGLEGQLTATFLADENELKNYSGLISLVREKCGRIIFNNFPTGVEVCFSMHHGGPYPSTTDSRFTSVGSDAIKRFLRPVAYQNWPETLLPDELKNNNPLDILRTINGSVSKDRITSL